jgi:hypothetical protein
VRCACDVDSFDVQLHFRISGPRAPCKDRFHVLCVPFNPHALLPLCVQARRVGPLERFTPSEHEVVSGKLDAAVTAAWAKAKSIVPKWPEATYDTHRFPCSLIPAELHAVVCAVLGS